MTADAIEKEARVRMRVVALHRQNQVAVANVLRAAAIDTLTSFDVNDRSTQPGFRPVTGMEENAPALGYPRHVEWRANLQAQAPGIEHSGDLYLVDAEGSDQVLARNVPRDSFLVRQEGRNLVLSLTTYFARDVEHAHTVTSTTVVSLRN